MNFDNALTLADLCAVYEARVSVALSPVMLARIDKGARAIASIVNSGATVYGVNTGFGLLASTTIARADLEALQRNLVLSHACGVGPLLNDDVVRLIAAREGRPNLGGVIVGKAIYEGRVDLADLIALSGAAAA